MANRQTSSSSMRKAPRTSGARSTSGTGERDENYDVISVLYHALQGADTIQKYVEDAREAQDDELLSFLEETRAEYSARAEQAKQLLASRLEGSSNGSGDVDDDDGDDD